jgi:recombinational DNA repair protein RecT
MMPSVSPLPCAISELFFQASVTGKITLADRYGIMASLLDEAISEDEIHCINRLLHALRQGRVQVVNELSTVL